MTTRNIQALHEAYKITLFQNIFSPYFLKFVSLFIFVVFYQKSNVIVYDQLNSLELISYNVTTDSSLILRDSDLNSPLIIDYEDQLKIYERDINLRLQSLINFNIQIIESHQSVLSNIQLLNNYENSNISNSIIAQIVSLNNTIQESLSSDSKDLKDLQSTLNNTLLTTDSTLDLSSLSDALDDIDSISLEFQETINELNITRYEERYITSNNLFDICIEGFRNIPNISIVVDNGTFLVGEVFYDLSLNSLNSSSSIIYLDSTNSSTNSSTTSSSSSNSSNIKKIKQLTNIFIIIMSVFICILFLSSIIYNHYRFKISKPFLLDNSEDKHSLFTNEPYLSNLSKLSHPMSQKWYWIVEYLLGKQSNFFELLNYFIVILSCLILFHILNIKFQISDIPISSGHYSSRLKDYKLELNQSINFEQFQTEILQNITSQVDDINEIQYQLFHNLTKPLSSTIDFNIDLEPMNLTYPSFRLSLQNLSFSHSTLLTNDINQMNSENRNFNLVSKLRNDISKELLKQSIRILTMCFFVTAGLLLSCIAFGLIYSFFL
ncbi:hypothetical protein WICMUC_005245 [Wickerhamomyces mucosus]|uniref:Uncharacterized protein n=1 Tax=Wickerhamomyces mucosus TaxID=1378264 RepID=A0A9P8P9T4_9ASCO|nr:hypothetical protein WICMUC_005245 [Wickerhamomyces mucosus]